MANKKLKADNARLKAEVERLTALKDACKRMIKRRDKWIYEHRSIRKQLVAEVERLTKAGDCLVIHVEDCYRAEGYDPKDCDMIDNWNAAKEGKQQP